LGVVIILVIMGIFMGAAVPVWQHVMQREREEELIWRGEQYVQAIELYQKKHPGAYPPKIEILVEQKFLRKAYMDPMVEDGEWKVLRQNSPEIRAMARAGGRRRAQGTAQQPAGQQRGTQQPGLRRNQQQQRDSSSRFSRSRSGLGAGGSELGLGGIVGVVSTSDEESIRVLDGKNKYNEWLFVALQETRGNRRPGGGRGRGVGRPGQGQQPGMGLPGQRQPGLQGPGRSLGLGQRDRQQGQQQQKNRPQ
jgi:type II secretory pathway pseudopilin PulG